MKRMVEFSRKYSVSIRLAYYPPYEKGVRLTKKVMDKIEETIYRIDGIEKWAVDILCYDD